MADQETSRQRYEGNGAGQSAGQLMKEVSEDISTLVRKEIELAKQEIGAAVSKKLKGAAILGVVATLGFFALIFLMLAIRDGLDVTVWTWLADILTAVILLVIGGIAALVAKKMLTAPISAERTKKTLKDDVEFAKNIGRRGDDS